MPRTRNMRRPAGVRKRLKPADLLQVPVHVEPPTPPDVAANPSAANADATEEAVRRMVEAAYT